MQGSPDGDTLIVCFGRSWRSLVCLLDQFFDETLGVSLAPLCRWHDWLLTRQFDRDYENAEPVELITPPGGIRILRVEGHPAMVESILHPPGSRTWTNGA